MSHSFRVIVTCVAVLAAAAVVPAAQQEPIRKDPTARQPQGKAIDRDQRPAIDRSQVQPGRALAGADYFFVSCLRSETENEIALAKLAQQRAQSEEVKKFAQQMIQDHTQFLEKLQALAPTEPAGSAAAAVQPTERQTRRAEIKVGGREDVAQDRTARPATASPTGGVDMMQLRKELGQQCLATLTAELERKSGPEFDRCFMGQQLFAHLAMWDALKVFGKHASPELQRTLASAQEQTEQHLQEARKILKDLESAAPRTASRPATK
jgi:predicted outer membrane protein